MELELEVWELLTLFYLNKNSMGQIYIIIIFSCLPDFVAELIPDCFSVLFVPLVELLDSSVLTISVHHPQPQLMCPFEPEVVFYRTLLLFIYSPQFTPSYPYLQLVPCTVNLFQLSLTTPIISFFIH